MDERKVITIPGAVWCYLTGTAVFQGQQWSSIPREEAAARRLEMALKHDVKWRKAGKGESGKVELDQDAAWVLWDYADTCIDGGYFGDGPTSETYAAKKLRERIEEAFGRPAFPVPKVMPPDDVVAFVDGYDPAKGEKHLGIGWAYDHATHRGHCQTDPEAKAAWQAFAAEVKEEIRRRGYGAW